MPHHEKLPTIEDAGPVPISFFSTVVESPVDILITDPLGRRLGTLYEDGNLVGEVDEIQNLSFYSGKDSEPEYILIVNPVEGYYDIELHGTEDGTYNLTAFYYSNGTTTISVRDTDIATTQNETHNYASVVDITPPIVDIINPLNNSFVSTKNVLILWNASDNVDLNYYEMLLDNVSYANTSETNITFNLSDGLHTVEVRAFDLANNSASDFVSFTIDTIPPEITITGVENGSYYNKNVSANISVFDVNLNSTLILLNGESYSSGAIISEEGTSVLEVYADDLASNSAYETIAFTIDKTPPLVNITSPTDGATVSLTVTINATAIDEISPPAGITGVFVNDQEVSTSALTT